MSRKQINELVKAIKFLRPRTSTGSVMLPSTSFQMCFTSKHDAGMGNYANSGVYYVHPFS